MSRKIQFVSILVLILSERAYSNDILDSCASKLCIPRCCSANKHMHRQACVTNKQKYPEEDPVVYTADLTPVHGSQVLSMLDIHLDVSAIISLPADTVLLKNGSIMVKGATKISYLRPEKYCMGHKWRSKEKKFVVRYFSKPSDINLQLPPESQKIFKPMDYFQIAAWLLSSFLLALVLAVYVLLKELRNLRGLVLMSYLASLLTAYTLLAAYGLAFIMGNQNNVIVQRACVLGVYFSLIACFCWTNVMSFDLWWTFRGLALVRAIHRRGELHKYLVYCTYGWVVPLLMTTAVVLLDEVDLSWQTWIPKPNIKNGAVFDGATRQFYLLMPILPVMLLNAVFFILTVVNIAHLNNGATRLNRNINSQKNRFTLYLKLSVVMGLNWLLECLSTPLGLEKYYVADVYNELIGVVIFFIFVKQNTCQQIAARYLGKPPTASQVGGSSGTDCISSFGECAPLQTVTI